MTINKETAGKLQALGTGDLAKSFVVRGKGLKNIETGAEYKGHPGLSDKTNVSLVASTTLALGNVKEANMEWALAQVKKAENAAAPSRPIPVVTR